MLAHLLPVAITSGHSVEDRTQRLGFSPRDVIGNHGSDPPRSRAAYILDSPAGVGIMLHRMLETLGVQP